MLWMLLPECNGKAEALCADQSILLPEVQGGTAWDWDRPFQRGVKGKV